MIVKLLSDFSDQIGSTKTTILQTVSEMKTESPLIREIIRSAFIDLDFEVRLAANDAAFAKYPNDISLQVLIAASLNDKDQSVQRRSKHYLGRLKPTDANVLKIIRDSARSGNVIAQELLKKLELNN